MKIKSILKSYFELTIKNTLSLFSVFIMVFFSDNAYATHAEGADITYKCLGGNQYEITLAFYRDCQGISAPSNPIINCKSITLGKDFNLQLTPIPGTGQEISPVCTGLKTKCQGGTYPGVQEWIYKGVVTLNAAIDWVFSYDLCCRNDAITTINAPGNQNIHIESTLDNLNFPCNSSPIFTVKPIPFVCIGQFFSFNHGAADADGDFLSYELITPMNGYGTTVTYLNPYTKDVPITSSPALAFDTLSGSLSMTPTAMEVTIFAVKVKQWKNNRLVGYVIRDIQVRVINCNNSYPYSFGINGSGTYVTNACVGSPVVFNIYTNDIDTTQTLTLGWNNGIAGGVFSITGTKTPTGTFSWTPGYNDIGMHFFTITIKDNNCPINGIMTYAIGIMVNGVNAQTTATSASCGINNGKATVTPTLGTAPYSYLWTHCNCTVPILENLPAGTYTAVVTDAKGCSVVKTAVVGAGPAASNILINATNASCYNSNNGVAIANVNGGSTPYTYQWSNGGTSQTISGLSAGTYSVVVTNADGCVKTEAVTIIQPTLLNTSVSHKDVLCYGGYTGTASATALGGTAPYSFTWNTGAITQTVSGLGTGNYFVVIKDANGCSNTQNVFINQPTKVVSSISSFNNISCNGSANGTATATAIGGTAPYSYLWNNGQTTQTVTNLNMGNHSVTISDSLGCTSTISVAISEPPAITSLMNVNHVKCYGMNNGSASATISGGNPSYSYLWSNGETGSAINNLSVGSYSVVVTDAKGCTKSSGVTISQPAILLQNITNVQHATCNQGNDGSAAVIVSGGITPYTYLWSNGQTTSAANMLIAGNYSVLATDANGCTVANTFSIIQPSAILLTFSPEDTICAGKSTLITASASGGTAPLTYAWQPNLGQGSQHLVSPATTTSYTAIITDANGCIKKGNTTVHVYPSNINLVVNATPNICLGQNATLSASAVGNHITSYYWSGNLGTGAGPYVVSPGTTTTYSVLVTNSCGTTALAATTVQVRPLPDVKLLPGAGAGCDEVQAQFSNSIVPNSGDTYMWDFGDGNTSAQVSPTHIFTQAGSYVISVTVTSTYGCSSSSKTTFDAAVTPSPDANFISDPPIETSIINPVFNFYDKSIHATGWTWSFGDGATSSQQNPHHTYSQTGVYTVKLFTINDGGCVDSIVRSIEVKPEFAFYIPNTFTPNGDNVNEFFTGKGEAIIEYKMTIFDRWGNQIFETNDLNKGWNGFVKDGTEIAQEDIYVYKIFVKDFQNKDHKYVGHVNIVK